MSSFSWHIGQMLSEVEEHSDTDLETCLACEDFEGPRFDLVDNIVRSLMMAGAPAVSTTELKSEIQFIIIQSINAGA